jgi:hypothetical protein
VARVDRYRHAVRGDGAENPKSNGLPESSGGEGESNQNFGIQTKSSHRRGSRVTENTPPLWRPVTGLPHKFPTWKELSSSVSG